MRKQSRPKSAFPCLRKLCTVAPKQLYLVPEKNENRRSQGGTRDFKPDGDDQRIVVGLKFSFVHSISNVVIFRVISIDFWNFKGSEIQKSFTQAILGELVFGWLPTRQHD